MIEVTQTIVSSDHGNCMQATAASLFELKLEEVPNFIEFKEDWFLEVIRFYRKMGIDCGTISNYGHDPEKHHFLREMMKADRGYKGLGFFEASIASQTFENVTHSVIINTEGTVVWDPNPNKSCLGKTIEHIKSIQITSDLVWHEGKPVPHSLLYGEDSEPREWPSQKTMEAACLEMGRMRVYPKWREQWSEEDPTWGFCYPIAEVMHHYLNRECLPHLIKTDEGTHWYCVYDKGLAVDFTTRAQDYTKGKPKSFLTKGPSKRARDLAKILGFDEPLEE
jgi:hypothetical protein